jgi:hypothetical protein
MRAVGFALLVSLWAASAQATVLVPMDTQELTARADRVLLGVVESQESHWTSDHQAIYTDVTVRVTTSYKGGAAPGERVVVRREGGNLDGLGMRVFGAAQFAVGEEVVLFTEKRAGVAYTVGMTQGKLHVYQDADGVKRVAADLGAVAFINTKDGKIRANARPATTTATAAKAGPRRLDELEREIRGYVRDGAQ